MPASFTDIDITTLSARVKRHEGSRIDARGMHAAYRCTSGALTVGYGHNCDASPVPGVFKTGDSISQETADTLFEADLAAAVWDVRRALPWVIGLEAPRQAVLYDMCFNMGLGSPVSGLLSFKNTLNLIANGRYAEASRNMLASKWARQVKHRAVALSRQMETGEWQ